VIQIEQADFVAVPSRDRRRSRRFYGATLGLRPDEHEEDEFWAGATCLAIWEPREEFQPSVYSPVALRVADVAEARADLESQGVEFVGETRDTGACQMAIFVDPDGNHLMLHRRYAKHGET